MRSIITNKYNLISFIYGATSSLVMGIGLIPFLGPAISLVIIPSLVIISFVVYRNKFFLAPKKLYFYLICIFLSVFVGNAIKRAITPFNIDASNISHIILLVGCVMISFYFLGLILRILILFISKAKANKEVIIMGISVSISFTSMLLIFMPSEIMLSNVSDYMISFGEFVKPGLLLALVLSLIFILSIGLLDKKISKIFIGLLAGLMLAMYVQNYFLNKNIGILNGYIYDWKKDAVYAIIDLLIWLIILAIPFVILKFKKTIYSKFCIFISVLIFSMLGSSFAVKIINAPKEAFVMKNYYFDNSLQFSVATKKNVIMFVLDAVDNDFITSLLERESDVFDEYKDFTLYTNTCSVFDETFNSLPQMLSGSDYDSTPVDFDEFYKRLHENDYSVRMYGYECGTSYNDIKKHIDNCVFVDATHMSYEVQYGGIVYNNMMLTLYQTLPNIAKNTINVKSIDFTNQVSFEGQDDQAIYDNEDFFDNLELSKSEEPGAFIVEHIDGAHAPKDDYVKATEDCLYIVNSYIEQLKTLGLYDDAVIIICSDHGMHDDEPDLYQTASTPMLMIKEAGNKFETMKISSAPVYHTDFLKTILVDIDLYSEEDGDRFGTSFYDYKEGDSRIRRWYNREYQTYYGYYYEYSYDGDYEELKSKVNNKEYKKVQ